MNFRAAIIGFVAAGLLTGCATGPRIEVEQYQRIQEGQTTRNELTSLLGQPTTTSFQGSDTVLLYQSSKVDAGSYIPFVNIFASGASVQQCLFTFGKNNILKSKMCNEGKS